MLKTTLLLLASLIVSVVLADVLFRWYEDRFLTLTLDAEEPIIDLQALNYNETSIARTKPKDEFRVLGFGDSYAYAIVKRAYTYHSVAQKLLNQVTEQPVRLVNLGEPAISFQRYWNAYLHWAPVIEHDAVVFNIFMGNDFTDANRKESPQDKVMNRIFSESDFNNETGRKRIVNIPRKFPLRMIDHAYAHYLALADDTHVSRSRERGMYNLALIIHDADWIIDHNHKQLINFDASRLKEVTRGWSAFADLVRTASRARQKGKKVMFVLAPNETQVIRDVPKKLVDRFQIKLGRYDFGLPNFLARELIRRIDPKILVMDLNESLACASNEGQIVYHPENAHWSVEGNQLVGEKLASAIAEHWLNGISVPGQQRCVAELPTMGEALFADKRRRHAVREFLEPLLATGASSIIRHPGSISFLRSSGVSSVFVRQLPSLSLFARN